MNKSDQNKASPLEAKRRFKFNVLSNAIYVLLNALLMLWYVSYLLHELGAGAYGIIPLANSLVTYFGILSSSLNVSLNRFLAIDFNQGDYRAANRTFNSSLALALGVSGLLVFPAMLVSYFFPDLFNVEVGLERESQLLIGSVCLTALLAIISGNFGVSSLIAHRFDLRNAVRAATVLTRVGVVVGFGHFERVRLTHVAIAFVISAIISVIGDIFLWKRLTPQLTLSLKAVDFGRFRGLGGLGGWSALNQVGNLLLTQTDLLVINLVFGAELTGKYGAILVLVALIFTVTETLITVLWPTMLSHFAAGDADGMLNMGIHFVKILGSALAIPVGLLCGFAHPLLRLWLGPGYDQMALILIIIAVLLPLNLAARPLAYVLTAHNRVRAQGAATVAVGLLNVIFAYTLAKYTSLGAIGVAIAGAVAFTLRNGVFLTLYVAKITSTPLTRFRSSAVTSVAIVASVTAASHALSLVCPPTSWAALLIMSSLIGVISCGLVLLLGFDREERQFFGEFLAGRGN